MTMSLRLCVSAAAVAATMALVGCSTMSSSAPAATAKLESTRGNSAKGDVRFVQTGDNTVRVSGEISGLKPNTEHGFHIHDKGDCGDNGNAAAGHFNPMGNPHGKYDTTQHHMGDLPSLKADSNGVASVNVQSRDITLLAGPGNVIDRAVIVHAQPDDYTTQPTGNAGARIACAVITRD